VTKLLVLRTPLLASIAAVATALFAVSVQAQNWPQRPIRIMVGFAPGGNIDNLARATCARLSEVFGQQFVIENKVGATGTLAANEVAHAKPDGYTFFWAGTGTVSIYPSMRKTPYDTVKDFTPVSMIATSPQVLIVNPKLPIKNLADFVAYVKARPKQLAYAGGGGPGSVSNLLMVSFLHRAGLQMNGVTYRGTAPALTDVIGGHIPTMFVPLPEALAQSAGGKIRVLAISDDKRAKQAPDIPTIAEQGFPGFRGVSWNGMLARTGTPKAIIDRIAAEFVKAAHDPKFIVQLDRYGATPAGLTPEEFGEFLKKDRAMWAEAVKAAGLAKRK
jgi:tripartite-type tricarboxylate transporter receptor subunit TctC